MLIVSCMLCGGWIIVVANERDTASYFAITAREEGRKPNRVVTITKDEYDAQAFGLTGACRGSFGLRPNCSAITAVTGSEGDSSHEAAAQYAADATEVDRTSDFDPETHFFGECRLPRVHESGAS